MRTSFALLACTVSMLAVGAAQAQSVTITPPTVTTPSVTAPSITTPRVQAPGVTRQPSAAQAAQQERMRNCNAEAGKRSLSGNNRRSFMSQCLSGRMPDAAAPAAPAAQVQQERMRACNTTASTQNLSGAARRTFMSTCLRGN